MIQITIYLDLIDQIDLCLKNYQDRYHELKNKKIKQLEDRKQRILEEGKEAKKEKKLDDSSDDEEEKAEEEKKEEVPEQQQKPRGLKAPPKNT